ncbi:MAG: hypothetical protein WAZ50_00450 [Minisyncoccia bacterium]
MSVSSWDCPAVITTVKPKDQTFRVRSLDDMKEQSQSYGFDCAVDTTASRASMYLVSKEEVVEYLDDRDKAICDDIRDVERKFKRYKSDLKLFRETRKILGL